MIEIHIQESRGHRTEERQHHASRGGVLVAFREINAIRHSLAYDDKKSSATCANAEIREVEIARLKPKPASLRTSCTSCPGSWLAEKVSGHAR